MLKNLAKLDRRGLTMMLGVLFLVGALFMTMSGLDRDRLKSAMEIGAASRLDVKTKSAERVKGQERERGDVVASFRKKAAEGMSVKKMRWIVDDFLAAGLGETSLEAAPSETYFLIMKKQHRWYADTLDLGLGLTEQQKREVERNLSEAADKARKKLDAEMASVKAFEVDGKLYKITGATELYALTDPKIWVLDEAYRPWNLCELDEGQMKFFRPSEEIGADADDLLMEEGVRESGEDELYDLIFELSVGQYGVFRAVSSQSSESDTGVLDGFSGLHPSQFRYYLLMRGDHAMALKKALDEHVD